MIPIEYEDNQLQEASEKFKFEVSFNYIKDKINKKGIDRNENSVRYIEWAKEYLNDSLSKINPYNKDFDKNKYRMQFMLESLDNLDKYPKLFYEKREDCNIFLADLEEILNELTPKIRVFDCNPDY
jgi:hypothetical protein